ncbi:MBL fold metallo-hydrolase [Bacteroides sp. UBA939]|uniref:MBL fold metallo-hydrolase n=1 Tax=Bacteroides sp. UBA939 TaxID=1946092 RepID=UPI0025BB397E|nr:MBL fold metallo-hydrolase [Bacteroides sp. UBA939]
MNNRFTISQSAVQWSLLLILLLPGYRIKAQEGVITFDVGSFAVTVLSEKQQPNNESDATEEAPLQIFSEDISPNFVSAFLVETGSKTILFDAGYDEKLFDNLKAYGKTAANVDAIMLTHMHYDHIGSLLQNQKKAFPSAELYIPKAEHDYWMSDKAMQESPEDSRDGFIQARNVIRAYQDKLHLFIPGDIEDTKELLPGIRGIAAYGHTLGHTGYMLESNNSKMFIWGDLIHVMAIQISSPETTVIMYDVNSKKAIESRLKLMKYLAEHRILVAGMHIPFPAIGDLEKNAAKGYKFTPICTCEGR